MAKLFKTPFRIIAVCDLLQVVENELTKALAEHLGSLAGSLHKLLVD
jgi:hypothetical protein